MRIAQVAPLWETVPPKQYGGTERVVYYLTEELVRRGHDVTLFASKGSCTSAHQVLFGPGPLRLVGVRDPYPYLMAQLAEVFQRADDFDVIHCHVDFFAFPFCRFVPTPVLHTLHGRLDLPDLPVVFETCPNLNLVAISQAHRLQLPQAAWRGVVYHGLPADLYRFHPDPDPQGYLVFLGRMSPEKRPDLAIEIAKLAGVPLKIAAKIDEQDREFFLREVRPRLDHPLIEFLGEVDDQGKEELLGGALGLLFPIDWPEPFGLTVIETLACGTPVISRPCGSMPELVVDGITGFLCQTLDRLVAAVRRLETIDRGSCRAHFEGSFTAEVMANKYETLYTQIVQPTPLVSSPAWRSGVA